MGTAALRGVQGLGEHSQDGGIRPEDLHPGQRPNPRDASSLTIAELQHFVVDGRCHGDGLSGEVWVVIEPLSHHHSCGRLAVSCQKAEHVVLASVSEGGQEPDTRSQAGSGLESPLWAGLRTRLALTM